MCTTEHDGVWAAGPPALLHARSLSTELPDMLHRWRHVCCTHATSRCPHMRSPFKKSAQTQEKRKGTDSSPSARTDQKPSNHDATWFLSCIYLTPHHDVVDEMPHQVTHIHVVPEEKILRAIEREAVDLPWAKKRLTVPACPCCWSARARASERNSSRFCIYLLRKVQ